LDILSHSLSGLALGTVLASFAQGPRRKLAILGIATFGGALPDLDAISMWSGFDRTFGSWFQLNQSGRFIYSAKFWYSHHAFFHSLLAPLLWLGLYYGLNLAWKGLSQKISPVVLPSLTSQS
jgi:hypothetical protein